MNSTFNIHKLRTRAELEQAIVDDAILTARNDGLNGLKYLLQSLLYYVPDDALCHLAPPAEEIDGTHEL